MKIYIASSWKNEDRIIKIARWFRDYHYEVDCFADASTGRYVFHFSEIGPHDKLTAISFLDDERSKKAFMEDKRHIDWCDCCLLILPAGNSSHLEAGYAKGSGKLLVIYHLDGFPLGKFDVMYGFADLITESLREIVEFLEDQP